LEDCVIRSLVGPPEVLEWAAGVLTAVGRGVAGIDLIPDVYDWENALKVTVTVADP